MAINFIIDYLLHDTQSQEYTFEIMQNAMYDMLEKHRMHNKLTYIMIKIDLHIHSSKSAYKENPGLVEYSTKEHIGTLLSKLKENDIGLFSITDHNRFDAELYRAIIHKIDNDRSINLLAGVEFDVILDDDCKKCHIITIFDVKNDNDYDKIEKAINENLLTGKENTYSRDDFEKILQRIGLGVILIANQQTGLDRHEGNTESFSESCEDTQTYLTGYITAVEVQKPKIEGILRHNLKEMSHRNIASLAGSDCHDWRFYPQHDKNTPPRKQWSCEAAILPTFKGLLMAVTSPDTRFNRYESKNNISISGFEINSEHVSLVNGINVIIGENGSGKSTLLDILHGSSLKSHMKKIKNDNKIQPDSIPDLSKIKYVEQGQLIERFNSGVLNLVSDEDQFNKIDNSEFYTQYETFTEKITEMIKTNINFQTMKDSLKCCSLKIDYMQDESIFVTIAPVPSSFNKSTNEYEEPLNKIRQIIKLIQSLLLSPSLEKYNGELSEIQKIAETVSSKIKTDYNTRKADIKLRNILYSRINDYWNECKKSSTNRQQEFMDYSQREQGLIDNIVKTINLEFEEKRETPNLPKPIKGLSQKESRGFTFNNVAAYNDRDMSKEYFSVMFNKGYQEMTQLRGIKTTSDFTSAVKGYGGKASKIEEQIQSNFDKFISMAEKESQFIMDPSDKEIGSTLGELSLAYYKYITSEGDWNILFVDQPEDNISNKKIKDELVGYFQSMRNSKQIIMVTHNPILVVNLDADNVIWLRKEKEKISLCAGPLELVDGDNSILDIIANTMDGGKETIERRLTTYGRDD